MTLKKLLLTVLLAGVVRAEYVAVPTNVTLSVAVRVVGFEHSYTTFDAGEGTWNIIATPVLELSRDLNKANDELGVYVTMRILADVQVIVCRAEIEAASGKPIDLVTAAELRTAVEQIALAKVLALYNGE